MMMMMIIIIIVVDIYCLFILYKHPFWLKDD